MGIFIRQTYIEKIEKYLGKDYIVVLTGQRRVGKSSLLKTMRDLMAQQADNNVIFIDKEKSEFDFIKNYVDLNRYVEQHRLAGKRNFILVDEVQDIEGFERSVRSLRTEPDCEVIVTGSNAKILSGELSTLIGGRFKEIHIYPLSYREFLDFFQLVDSDDALSSYIQFGGMPGLAKIGLDEEDAFEYLHDILNTVLLKDVILRNKVRNVVFLENLVRFLADNIGKIISANSLTKYMKSQGQSVTPTTVLDYMRYLEQAFILKKVNRYDLHGKRVFELNHKSYFEDHGLRNALCGTSREGDIEKVIENVIFQQLLRLGYSVTVGQLRAGEIDFVCQKNDGSHLYVQASYVIADQETRNREFGNLRAIQDNYPKYVISMTPLVSRSDDNGIIHLHLRRFLMADGL